MAVSQKPSYFVKTNKNNSQIILDKEYKCTL